MDYLDLKKADAALGIADPVAAAQALNVPIPSDPVDIASADARSVLLLSGEWFKVKQLARQPVDGSARDQAIAAADICVDALTLTTTLRTSEPEVWTAMQPMIGALLAAGVVSTESVAAWSRLRIPLVPRWPVVLSDQDILAARSL